MCGYCENIKTVKQIIKEDSKTRYEFPERERLVLAKIGKKIIFYGFNKYAYEDDAEYENMEVNFCPVCGRKLK